MAESGTHGNDEANLQLQSEELYALQSIYGAEDCQINRASNSCEISIPCNEQTRLRLQVYFPASYPSTSAPLAQLSAPHLSSDQISSAVAELEELFSPGESIVYQWVEWLKESEDLKPPSRPPEPQEAAHPRTEADSGDSGLREDAEGIACQSQLWNQAKLEAAERAEIEASIVHGEPFTDRKSTFQGHLAEAKSNEDVEKVMAVLLENPKIQRATHNILAYRIETGNGAFLQDCADDGEAAAGGRLLHLLQIVDARDVVVVVTRWFGGIHLGPARFTHINNAARQLLDQCGYIAKEGSAKKGKKTK